MLTSATEQNSLFVWTCPTPPRHLRPAALISNGCRDSGRATRKPAAPVGILRVRPHLGREAFWLLGYSRIESLGGRAQLDAVNHQFGTVPLSLRRLDCFGLLPVHVGLSPIWILAVICQARTRWWRNAIAFLYLLSFVLLLFDLVRGATRWAAGRDRRIWRSRTRVESFLCHESRRKRQNRSKRESDENIHGHKSYG